MENWIRKAEFRNDLKAANRDRTPTEHRENVDQEQQLLALTVELFAKVDEIIRQLFTELSEQGYTVTFTIGYVCPESALNYRSENQVGNCKDFAARYIQPKKEIIKANTTTESTEQPASHLYWAEVFKLFLGLGNDQVVTIMIVPMIRTGIYATMFIEKVFDKPDVLIILKGKNTLTRTAQEPGKVLGSPLDSSALREYFIEFLSTEIEIAT